MEACVSHHSRQNEQDACQAGRKAACRNSWQSSGVGTQQPSHPQPALSRYAAGYDPGTDAPRDRGDPRAADSCLGLQVLAFGMLLILLLITWSIGRVARIAKATG